MWGKSQRDCTPITRKTEGINKSIESPQDLQQEWNTFKKSKLPKTKYCV